MNILSYWNLISSFFYIKLKPILILILLIISCSDLCYGQKRLKTIAVLEFQDNSLINNPELNGLINGLPSLFINAFSNIKNLQIIDRSILRKILDKQALNQTGLLEKDSIQKVGNLTGANYLILGSFFTGISDDIRIDCRIVNSESGQMIKAEEVTGKIDEIFELTEDLSFKLLADLDIKFTNDEDSAIKQSFKGCSYQNLISYSLALIEIDIGNKKNAEEILENLITDCPEFNIAKELLKEIRLAEKNNF